jgi:hypothetical protein
VNDYEKNGVGRLFDLRSETFLIVRLF